MVEVHPFRALRYHEGKAESWGSVIAPPYDVIDPEEQERRHQLSPYNIVRLILGRRQETDSENENWYLRAKRDFDSWRRNGILSQDATPALYLVEHRFTFNGKPHARLGFTALLELQEDVSQNVHRHEQTLSGPKADRTRLLETIPANLESVFLVYPDDGGKLEMRLRAVAERQAPTSRAAVAKGEEIRLWAVVDTELALAVKKHLGSVPLLIADGHHRFEVAFAHRQRYKALMSHFVSMADGGLIVQAIHRLIPWDKPGVLEKLRELCDLTPQADRQAALQTLGAQSAPGRFAVCHRGRIYSATVKAERLEAWLAAPSVAAELAGLDVSILHGLILPALEIPASSVTYHADPARVERQAAETSHGTAWLLRPIALPVIHRLASGGHVLPPKSTYFYPKVWSGLTINPLA